MEEASALIEKLMALLEVVEAGGFTAGSLRSGVPTSRLSRSVAALERELGVSLLVRNSRRFKVTELGQRMAMHARNILTEASLAVAHARDALGEPAGPLRITCPTVLASLLVGPLAMEFVRTYPRVSLTLDSTDGRPSASGEPADLLIQPSREALDDSERVARRLVDVRYALVASPELFAQLGRPVEADQLRDAPAIGWSFQSRPSRWPLVRVTGERVDVDMVLRFTSDNLLQIAEAARQGVGIAQLPPSMLQEDLAAGRLCIITPNWAPPPVAIWALYPARNALTLAGRTFLEQLAVRAARLSAESGP